jgi:hypothetical protein
MRELVRRATAYPYAIPAGSFVQVGDRTLELPADLDLAGRSPLLSYGSNAAPEALTRKLAAAPDRPLPLIHAELSDFDVVYSAHVSPYGAVPATLWRSPGTTVSVHVAFPDEQQRTLLAATEPNYDPTRLREVRCRLGTSATVAELDAFVSRHGRLLIDGAEVALAEIGARARRFGEMTQPRVLDHVRTRLLPDLSLEDFLTRCVATGGFAPLRSDGGEAP